MKTDIERKIAEYAEKLKSLDGPDDKRIKKRVLAALGKLKKDLAECNGAVAPITDKRVVADDYSSTEITKTTEVFKNAETTLTRKQLKAKLKLLNKELADYAQKKQLKIATKRFFWGLRKGMEPDKHTYANLLNCHVRCGDLDGALKHFAEMIAVKLSPNIVIYTVLLKGYCDKGDLSGARNLFFTQIPSCKLSPGIRTVNTFIRGCTKIGAPKSALSAYCLLKGRSRVMNNALVIQQKDAKLLGLEKKRKRSDGADDDDNDDSDNDDDDEDDDISSSKCKSKEEEELDENDESSGNASLFESVVALLCQALQVDKASVLAMDAINSIESSKGKMKTNNTTDYASMYANLSKACLFIGNCEEAQKFLNCALTALESSKSSQLRNSMQQNRENESRKKNNEDGLKDNKRSKAIDLFLRHRRAEIESEVESISHCLSALKSLHSLPLNCSQAEALKIGFLHTLSRVLHFGFNGLGDYDDSSYPVDSTLGIVPVSSASSITVLDEEMTPTSALILAVKDKFGLDRVHQVVQPSMNTSDTLRADQRLSNKCTDLILEECKREVTAKLSRSLVSDTGFIDFNELFRTVKSCSKSTASSSMDIASDEQDEEDADADEVVVDSFTNRLPVNMEICSGSGEWVVSHAASDLYHRSNKHDKRDKSAAAPPGLTPRALWLALELRCDRVYHTICRSVLENLVRHSQHVRESSVVDSAHAQSSPPEPLILGGLSNLAVIGGDASHILPNRIAPGSIANVYINHPEPPERTGGVGDSEGQHLLTQSFFTEIHRILSKEGKCTIVTDNLPYAKSLLQALGKTSICEKKSSSRKKVYFTSMILPDTADGNLKSRVLEEEIAISTTQSSETMGNERKKDVIQKAKIKMKRTDSDDSSEEDEVDEEDNVGYEDDYTYVNDEDVVPLNGNIKSVINKLKQNAQSNNKNPPRVTMKISKAIQNVEKEKVNDGRGSEVQVLQLWRGDSAEVDDTDGNGDDRASSYFDRMWERGQKKRRYFMVLKKGL